MSTYLDLRNGEVITDIRRRYCRVKANDICYDPVVMLLFAR